mgnify:CR=1 FL=1
MERFTFLIASAAFCLFVTVALTSAMSGSCLCDGLPGSQCEYCDETEIGTAYSDRETTYDTGLPSYDNEYVNAWEQEHLDFHHAWVREHEVLHTQPRTEEEHRAFHQSMDDGHRDFHGVIDQQSGQ